MKDNLLLLSLVFAAMVSTTFAVPTDGFAPVPFTYYIQYPYDLQMCDRYGLTNGIHSFQVYATDKPFQSGSATQPRTEMRFYNDYTNGVWQFEGDLFVPSGTTGAAVMQVFGGTTASTACQLRVYANALCRYTTPVLTNIYDRWIHVNVTHDADAHTVAIYLDGNLARTDADRGPATYYFKCGVYVQNDPSNLLQAQWKNLKVWRRAPKVRSLVLGNNSLVISGTNGTPGTACYVLASTNLATPPTNWAHIATNSFDSNGGFVRTNVLNPDLARQFYLLQSP